MKLKFQSTPIFRKTITYSVLILFLIIIIFPLSVKAQYLNCGDDVEYEGETYPTVAIGTQCWLAKNLNVGTRIAITNDQTNNSTIEKYCYDNNESNCDTYGGLYQWNEAMQYITTEGTQGICPSGWHIPTDAELYSLAIYLGSGMDIAGGKMKQIGTTLWASPNEGATNSSGFTAFPAGFHSSSGFSSIGLNALFWSSSISNSNAFYWFLSYSNTSFAKNANTQANGFSVRCLSDDPVTPIFNNSITPINLEIQPTISISCDSTVTMNPIVSTGRSTVDSNNEATCTVSTNNSGGYKLEWSASSIAMSSGTPSSIAPFDGGMSDIPKAWSVASSASEWGARLKSTSTDTASEWGTADGYDAGSNWLNVSTSPRQIVSRTSETSSSTQIIQFGAEIGSTKLQPTGEYEVNITFTATTL
jgi:uncharacterized protein (TIGR02145 family)